MVRNIKAADFTVARIFSSEFNLEIPPYRYPFKWDADEGINFYDHIFYAYTRATKQNHCLGTIVLLKQANDAYSVVLDGYQRLATLTILLAAITERLNKQDRDYFNDYILNCVQTTEPASPAQNSRTRLLLHGEDRDFFTHHIKDLIAGTLPLEDPVFLECEIRANIKGITRAIRALLDNHFSNDAEALKNFGSFVVHRCYVVALLASDLATAFPILTNKGSNSVNLQASDILRINRHQHV